MWGGARLDPTLGINYCLEQRDGTLRSTAVRIDKAGNTSNQELPGEIELRKGLWQVRRTARSDKQPVTLRDLEDTPFYTRSLLRYDDCEAVHEYLDLDRFQSGWVRFLLPFRMPRKA